jgi:Ricin-type beta-trefoil lectin domain
MKHRRRAAYTLCAAVISTVAWLVPGAADAATALHLKEAEQGKCLDIRTQDGATTDGARLQRFTCHNVAEQFWEPIDLGGDSFMLRNPRSQLCVAVDSAAFGAQVVQRRCVNGNRGEIWVADGFFVKGGGFNALRSALDGSCLDTLGQFVKTFPCNRPVNRAQLWELV